jgi:hypothetical protein
MVKGRYNFTMTDRSNERLDTLVKESVKYLGRVLTRSELIELLIDKAFLSKKEQLKERLMELEKEKSKLSEELEKYLIREKELMAGEF